MDFVGPVIDIVNRAWDCGRSCTSYLRNLRENLDALKVAAKELRNVRDDVKEKVDMAEAQRMVRTHIVGGWLQRVEDVEADVDELLQQGSKQIKERRLRGCCCLKNCWKSYKFGKKVVEKLSVVNKLKNEGKFDEVANTSQGVLSSQPVPEYPTVGMEMLLEKVLKLLEDNDVRIMGLYGTGGVGKTTLLKKIKNKFVMKGSHDVVIWVVVSKEVNLGRIQKEIGKELGFSWEGDKLQNERTETILSTLSRKKFVLLLDDCWGRVDLEMLGIPHPQMVNKGDKIVFTTRSEMVCGHMEATTKIRVECLDPKKAWDLFREKVGEEALNLHPEICELAYRIAKECGGLPLALLTVGRTMESKKTLEEWKHALTILQKSAPEFLGIEHEDVFRSLKFSYDCLKDDAHKSCFLYLSLFPEDYVCSKEKLIWFWIGEGFLDGYENNEEAFNKGNAIIGSLTAVCLFEYADDNLSDVKMHDVIRDLAIWIGCECGGKKNKFLVRTGANLSKAPPFEQWKEAERVSLMNNHIKCLEDPPISFKNLLTLNLEHNSFLQIGDNFFRSTPKLKVLNLEGTMIAHFPISITYLRELQYLNLQGTYIANLPDEFVKLVNLKILNLNLTPYLREVPAGMISCLSKLQYLSLFYIAFKTQGFGGYSDGDAAGLVELESLEHLSTLSLSVKSTRALQKVVNSNKFQMCVKALRITICKGLVSLILSLSLSSSSLVSSSTSFSVCLGSMKNLQDLEIHNCSLREIVISWARVEEESSGQVNHGLLPELRFLELRRLPNLSITWAKGVNSAHTCFQKLARVYIEECDALVDLTWLIFAPRVKYLRVYHCKGITKIVDVKEVAVTVENLNLFSRLAVLDLSNLPSLRFIVDGVFPFPSLKTVGVRQCPRLKKLPFDSNGAANKLQVIRDGSFILDFDPFEDD